MQLRRPFLPVLLLALLSACGSKPGSIDAKGKGSGPGAGAAGVRPIPVMTAPVQKRDVPIYLEGMGSAVAFQSVTIRSQVDGVLEKVFFTEGQHVKKGDLIAQIDPRPFMNQLLQAQGQLARDQATLKMNQRDMARSAELVKNGLISTQDNDQQQGAVGQTRGAIRVDQANIRAAQLNLSFSKITSPLDGVTGIRIVDPGNVIHAADPNGLVVVTQLDPIGIIFTLPQDDLGAIAEEKAKGPLEVQVFGRDGTSELGRGQLTVIDNEITANTATLRLKAVLANPNQALWPNQFVKIRLMLRTRNDALVIPAAAIQRGPQGTFVYTVGDDQTVQAAPISIDLLQGNDALIASGLTAGQTIVTEGQNQLRPGSKVSLRAASPGSAAPGQPAEAAETSRGVPGAESNGKATP